MSRRQTLLFGWILAGLAIALFASLGSWQYGRQGEKQGMLDAVQQVLDRRRAQPLAIAADPAAARGYDWAAGEGRFADAPALLLDNQQRNGRSGVRVYRVFEPAAAGSLLVELGWLPLPPERTMPEPGPPPQVTRIEGLLLPPPSPGLVATAMQPQADGSLLMAALRLEVVADALGSGALAPRVLRLDPALPFGYQRDLEILHNTLPPEKHLGYAVQWYGLALTVLVTALILTFRRKRGSATPPGMQAPNNTNT